MNPTLSLSLSISGVHDCPQLDTVGVVISVAGRTAHTHSDIPEEVWNRMVENHTLFLRFDDVWDEEDIAEFHPPTPTHVEATLKLLDDVKPTSLHIHCYAGVSRSTALGLLALKWANPTVSDDELVAELLRVRPYSLPNPLLVELIDERLGCDFSSALSRVGLGWRDPAFPGLADWIESKAALYGEYELDGAGTLVLRGEDEDT